MEDLVKQLSLSSNNNSAILPEPETFESAAAVLILLVKDGGDWKIVYTRRTTGVRTHQGEVSFPGGAHEFYDADMVQTALRETHEEIGIKQECIKVIGSLDPIRTISNFIVYPIVGIMECNPDFVINHDEVDRVFLIPLSWLKNPENYYEQDHLVENQFVRRVIHYHNFDGEHLWGLTARITQKLLAI